MEDLSLQAAMSKEVLRSLKDLRCKVGCCCYGLKRSGKNQDVGDGAAEVQQDRRESHGR